MLPSVKESDTPDGRLPNAARSTPGPPPVAGAEGAAGQPPAGESGAATARPFAGIAFWHELLGTRGLISFLVSFTVHVMLIVVLSLLVSMIPDRPSRTVIVTTNEGDAVVNDTPDDLIALGPSPDSASSFTPQRIETRLELSTDRLIDGSTPPTRPSPDDAALARPSDAMLPVSRNLGGGFQGRTSDYINKLVGSGPGGPTQGSQGAVEMGLQWLAEHQWQDGGWRLDLTKGPCGGRCGDSGKVATSTGATGLALLAYLGAGHTHMSGEYRDVVDRGLYYLRQRIINTPHGADLQEGTMYAQGIATIALCEAYAMTQDASLREPAQRAIDFICYAQHSGGGWRYQPNTPGDTTVFGWQMMALKSALLAGLDVPSPTLRLGERFLDSVQTGRGSYYGYTIRGKSSGPTSVGLLIRMYSGWDRDDPRLTRGVQFLVEQGPQTRDMYFNYYASQVLHHYGGPEWLKWNEKLRDYLVEQQATTGHERGSWFFVDQHGSQGGRLYTTAMCIMILEVYYRHMPLYGEMAVEKDRW